MMLYILDRILIIACVSVVWLAGYGAHLVTNSNEIRIVLIVFALPVFVMVPFLIQHALYWFLTHPSNMPDVCTNTNSRKEYTNGT